MIPAENCLDFIDSRSMSQSCDINGQCSFQSTSVDNRVQTDVEHEQPEITRTSTVQSASSEIKHIEDGAWNETGSILKELNLSIINTKNFNMKIVDNETQSDDQLQGEFTRINNKMKEMLQTIEEKVYQIVVERPDLFLDASEDIIERIDRLISSARHKTSRIAILQKECSRPQHQRKQIQRLIAEMRLCILRYFRNFSTLEVQQCQLESEDQVETEQRRSENRSLEEYLKAMNQFEQNNSRKDEDQHSLGERLSEVELDLKKTSDSHESMMIELQVVRQEHDRSDEQQPSLSTEK